MALVDINELARTVDPVELTVRAQTFSPNDNGMLHWDEFMPRRDVSSTRLGDIAEVDFRPTATRRDWNGEGLQIPLRTGKIREGDMLPIESFFVIGEKEIQRYAEGFSGRMEMVVEAMKADLPQRVDGLAKADYRKLEVDVFTAWAYGYAVVNDPEGHTYNMSYGIDSSRYIANGTTLALATNAYTDFITFLRSAEDLVGGIEGALLRRTLMDTIIADAPATGLLPSYSATQSDVEKRIQDTFGVAFKFRIAEWQTDVADAAQTFTRTKYWPATRIAAIPMGGTVGVSAFAPVYRAMDIDRTIPEAGVDVRGVTTYSFAINDAKGLKTQGQLNAMPMPDENKICVLTGC